MATASETPSAQFTLQGAWRGARAVAPILIVAAVFGLAFGAAASEAGLTLYATTLMSAVVFAGASQFAALDLWAEPMPWAALITITFAINARHILMGAVVYPWMRPLPHYQRYAALVVMTDANWAAAVRARSLGETDFAYLMGSGLIIWVIWVPGTIAGALASNLITAPEKLALDAVMACFFAALLAGMFERERDVPPWLVAAATALASQYVLPGHWYIVAGGLAGGLIGALRYAK
ncbi:MAG: AzlC family ABC transporter permease [Geminicoccaceae bacterium]